MPAKIPFIALFVRTVEYFETATSCRDTSLMVTCFGQTVCLVCLVIGALPVLPE